MKEFAGKGKDYLKKRWAKVGTAVSGAALLLSGCAVATNASPASIGRCGGLADYTWQGGNRPITNAKQLLAQGKQDAVILRNRVDRNDGQLVIPDEVDQGNYVLTTTEDQLDLGFPSNTFWHSPQAMEVVSAVDRRIIWFHGGQPEMTLGSIICTGGNAEFYPTQTFTAMSQLVTATNVLGWN
jgi:hypothetical protein